MARGTRYDQQQLRDGILGYLRTIDSADVIAGAVNQRDLAKHLQATYGAPWSLDGLQQALATARDRYRLENPVPDLVPQRWLALAALEGVEVRLLELRVSDASRKLVAALPDYFAEGDWEGAVRELAARAFRRLLANTEAGATRRDLLRWKDFVRTQTSSEEMRAVDIGRWREVARLRDAYARQWLTSLGDVGRELRTGRRIRDMLRALELLEDGFLKLVLIDGRGEFYTEQFSGAAFGLIDGHTQPTVR